MAGYGFMGRGYTTNNGVKPRTNEWSKTGYDGNGCTDNVCRPVIVKAEGRKKPIICYTPNNETQSYVTQTETVFEQVYTPVMSEYEYGSPPSSPPKSLVNNKWGRGRGRGMPLSPVRDRPQKVEEFITQVQTEVSRPTRIDPFRKTNWPQAPYSTGNYQTTDYDDDDDQYGNFSNNEWGRGRPLSPVRDRPQKVECEYGSPPSSPPTGVSRPTRIEMRRQTPNSTGNYGTTDYDGEYSNFSNNEWNKPTDHTIGRKDMDLDDHRRKNDGATKIPSVGRDRPSRNTRLTSPTNHIKEPTKSSSVTAASPKAMDSYTEIIDSAEAARRYKNASSQASRPFVAEDTSKPTIDSREAAKKYGGVVL